MTRATEPKPRLLLVDDELDMLDFLERALRRTYDVMRFSDPLAALAAVRRSRFDVLITDQRMPELSGLALIEEAAQLWPRSVRLLISGYSDAPELAEALSRATVHNFVLKPIDASSLMAAIATATARAEARRHSPRDPAA